MKRSSKIISLILSLIFMAFIAIVILPKAMTISAYLIMFKTLFMISPKLSLNADQIATLQNFMSTEFPRLVKVCVGIDALALLLFMQSGTCLYDSLMQFVKPKKKELPG